MPAETDNPHGQCGCCHSLDYLLECMRHIFEDSNTPSQVRDVISDLMDEAGK